jgi:hypothetical protein|tara:strand:+ start:988 stop:1521 length:534 start_codon:yes stop_codon:yes gene_type:complete
MKLPNSAKDFEKIMKNVDFTRVLQITVPILQPVIIGGLWLLLSRVDKRADALSKLIAIAEPIPTIDLNLPQPVVLASMYHSVDEFSKVLEEVIQMIKDFDIPTTEDIIKEIKEEILPDPIDKKEVLTDFQDCLVGYERDTPNFLKSKTTKALYVNSCLLRKGYASKVIKETIREYLS